MIVRCNAGICYLPLWLLPPPPFLGADFLALVFGDVFDFCDFWDFACPFGAALDPFFAVFFAAAFFLAGAFGASLSAAAAFLDAALVVLVDLAGFADFLVMAGVARAGVFRSSGGGVSPRGSIEKP